MELKYVGDMPLVSKTGVSFDRTQPDKYKFLQAAVELLEALSYGVTQTTQHLYKTQDRELTSSELMELIKKHMPDIENAFVKCDKKAHDFVHDLVDRVKVNDALSVDEKTAWLENIKIMRAYYYQYIINNRAYEAALQVLGDEIHDGNIQEVSVPMFKNYGLVVHDLVKVLEQRKAPMTSMLKIEQTTDGVVGKLIMTNS